MKTKTFVRRTEIAAPAEELERWHHRPGAFLRLTPPWLDVKLVESVGEPPKPGSRVGLEVRIGPLRKRFLVEHLPTPEGLGFIDVQRVGPFKHWRHTHRFEKNGNGGSVLEDRIEYALPGGRLGALLGGGRVRKHIARMFAYRHGITADDIRRHAMTEPKTIAITGAGGLVGSALVPFLTAGGHRTFRVKRDGHDFKLGNVSGGDAFVHLAGENIATGRWTKAKKDRIRTSRVEGTRQIAEHLASLENPPKVFVCASAIGYYGDRGDEVLTEESEGDAGFLPDTCALWEDATAPAREAGIRVVNLRIGVILTPAGGALKKMMTPFKLGVGGRMGNGKQYMSWVGLDDVLGAILHAIDNEDLEGPVNVVAPEPVTNAVFTKTLGRVLRRPTILPMPGFAARLAFGEMAKDLLLASTRVVPAKLEASGYEFRDRELESALRRLLGRA